MQVLFLQFILRSFKSCEHFASQASPFKLFKNQLLLKWERSRALGLKGILGLFYKQQFISNYFETSRNLEKNKQWTSFFSKNQATLTISLSNKTLV